MSPRILHLQCSTDMRALIDAKHILILCIPSSLMFISWIFLLWCAPALCVSSHFLSPTSASSYMNVTITDDDDDDTRTQFYVRFPSFRGLTSKNKSSIIPRSLKIQNQTTTVKIKSRNIVFILSETFYHSVSPPHHIIRKHYIFIHNIVYN